MKQYLGFDVGGTSIKVGVVEENARVVYHEKLPIPPDYDAFHGAALRLLSPAEEGISDPLRHRRQLLRRHQPGNGRGVCQARAKPDLPHRPGILQAAGNGGRARGAGKRTETVRRWARSGAAARPICRTSSHSCWVRGFGGAVCVGGKVFTGAHFLAGDMGYAYPLPEDTSYGQYIAPVEVEKRYRELTGGFKTIPEMKQTQDDDPAARDCYLRFIDGLANALLTMQYVMDPEMFLLGGGITSWPELIPELEAHIAALVQRRDGPLVPHVRACTHQNDANLLGAVYNLKQTFGL